MRTTADLLSENTYKLTLGAKQEEIIVNKILEYLKKMGADGPTILSKFSPIPQQWVIPPMIIAGHFYGWDFSYGSNRTMNLTDLVTWYRSMMLTIDKTRDSKSLVNFAIKFVLIAQMVGDHRRVVISGSDCYIEFHRLPPAGIRDNQVLGAPCKTPVKLKNVEDLVKAPRGVETAKDHTVYDRIKVWMDENFDYVLEYESVEYGLALLKRMGSYKSLYKMEQGLFNLNKVSIAKGTKFDLDFVDEFRDMWLASDTVENKFRDMYTKLVHGEYITTGKWKTLFGYYPLAEPDTFTSSQVTRITQGIDKFIEFALLEIRKAKV